MVFVRDEHVDERSGGSIVSAPEERVGFAFVRMVGFVITPSNTPAGGGGEG